MICANRVGDGRGFGDVESSLAVSWDGGSTTLGPAAKEVLARALVSLLGERCGQARDNVRAIHDQNRS